MNHYHHHDTSTYYKIYFSSAIPSSKIKKNFVPHCPEALRYAKVWGRDVVRSLTLAYAIYKILFNKSVSGNVA